MNMMNLITQFGQFMKEPTKFVPQEYLNNPMFQQLFGKK